MQGSTSEDMKGVWFTDISTELQNPHALKSNVRNMQIILIINSLSVRFSLFEPTQVLPLVQTTSNFTGCITFSLHWTVSWAVFMGSEANLGFEVHLLITSVFSESEASKKRSQL